MRHGRVDGDDQIELHHRRRRLREIDGRWIERLEPARPTQLGDCGRGSALLQADEANARQIEERSEAGEIDGAVAVVAMTWLAGPCDAHGPAGGRAPARQSG